MMRRHNRLLPLSMLAVASLTGCGPKGLLQLGVHDYPQNVQLGAQHSPSPPPLPALGANIEPGSPGFLIPPLPAGSGLPFPSLSPTSCPTANPLGSPRVEATADVQRAPVPGAYHY